MTSRGFISAGDRYIAHPVGRANSLPTAGKSDFSKSDFPKATTRGFIGAGDRHITNVVLWIDSSPTMSKSDFQKSSEPHL